MAAPMGSSDEDVFGNSALFEEFTTNILGLKQKGADKDSQEESKKNDLEAEIEKLKQENLRLQAWLKVCIQARGYKVSEGKQDGPIAQVVYMNHDSVCKYRHEVENFFEHLCMRSFHQQMVAGDVTTKYDDTRPLPQRSSMVLTEDPDPAAREAFTATGNVQYYLSFCLDSLGRPLLDGNAQLTEGWEIPQYPLVFRDALPIDEKPSAPSRGGRPKATCFNCGDEKHGLRECPLPRDFARINQNKQLFMDQVGSSPSSTISGRRYHKEGEAADKFKQYKPGVIGDALREALGITPRHLPPYIYGMRRLGYPPGHMLDAQVHKSALKVYNIKDTDEEGELAHGDDEADRQPRYNLKKIIEFPGFNVAPGDSVRDEWRKYNSVPMQAQQQKEALEMILKPLAVDEAMLTPSNKRRNREFSETGSSSKRRRTDHEATDMEVETDDSSLEDTPSRGRFQPPLPPTPEIATPPPLPPGSAPPTPIRTPHRDSPGLPSLDDSLSWQSGNNSRQSSQSAASRQNSQESSRSASPDLDRLMVERMKLLAALDNPDDSTVSSSEAKPSGVDTTEEEEEGEMESESDKDVPKGPQDQAEVKEIPGADGLPEDTRKGDQADKGPQGLGENGQAVPSDNGDSRTGNTNGADASLKESPDSPEVADGDCKPSMDSSQAETLDLTEGDSSVFTSQEIDDNEERPNLSGVPHRRKFSVNITPHDFDEDAPKKKGIFQKLLGILKRDKK